MDGMLMDACLYFPKILKRRHCLQPECAGSRSNEHDHEVTIPVRAPLGGEFFYGAAVTNFRPLFLIRLQLPDPMS
jgi:hypothetical protein